MAGFCGFGADNATYLLPRDGYDRQIWLNLAKRLCLAFRDTKPWRNLVGFRWKFEAIDFSAAMPHN
jgi:hypothetical protein